MPTLAKRNYSPRRPERSEGSPASGSMFASGDPSSQAPRDDGRAVTAKLIIIAVMLNVSACSMKKSPQFTEDMNRKIHTARINAQLGIAYLEKNDVQRAKQKLLLSLNQAPNIPEPWYSMAYFLEATGNKQEAKAYYIKAIEVAPKQGEAKNNYGTFLCRSGEYQAAIQQFALAAHQPNYLNPAAAYENAGLCALKIPDNKLASGYFKLALKSDPTRSLSREKLANLTNG